MSSPFKFFEGFSGIDGLKLIRDAFDNGEQEFDIAFIDFNMPFMSGA